MLAVTVSHYYAKSLIMNGSCTAYVACKDVYSIQGESIIVIFKMNRKGVANAYPACIARVMHAQINLKSTSGTCIWRLSLRLEDTIQRAEL